MNNNPNLIKTPIKDSGAESETSTVTHKGTETLSSEFGDTEHINSGDNPARQPDMRDQNHKWFDKGVNESTMQHSADIDESPKSDEITDQNRYANLNNAQKRVLPETDQ